MSRSSWRPRIPADPPLPRDEAIRLAVAARGGDRVAYERLLRSVVKLVTRTVVRMNKQMRVADDDLFSVAMLGFDAAIKHFDEKVGVAFPTYLIFWLKAFIGRELVTGAQAVALPRTVQAPGGIGAGHDVSIDAEEDSLVKLEASRPDLFATPDWGAALTLIDMSERRAMLDVVLAKRFTVRERDIFKRRFLNVRTETLEEIGADYSLSRERVRQIEKLMLAKLARAFGIEQAALTSRLCRTQEKRSSVKK